MRDHPIKDAPDWADDDHDDAVLPEGWWIGWAALIGTSVVSVAVSWAWGL